MLGGREEIGRKKSEEFTLLQRNQRIGMSPALWQRDKIAGKVKCHDLFPAKCCPRDKLRSPARYEHDLVLFQIVQGSIARSRLYMARE